jgi:hypothetical protein
MKLNETETQLRAARLKYIDTRWEQLNGLEKEAGERAIKYLMLTNAGGAVAMLSYFGANEEARTLFAAKFALGFFLLGILFVGILDALILHQLDRIFKHWRQASQQYLENNLDWETLDQGMTTSPTESGPNTSWGIPRFFVLLQVPLRVYVVCYSPEKIG